MPNDHRPHCVILTTAHPALDRRVFHKEAVSLAGAGYRVTLIARHGGNEQLKGVNVIALPTWRSRAFRMLLLPGIAVCKALRTNADVYHLHDPELLMIGLLLRFAGRRVVFDMHEDVPIQILSKHWIPHPLRKCVSIAYRRFERFALRRFDGVIAATDDIARKLADARPVIVRNYPDLTQFTPRRPVEPPSSDIPTAVYVGGITKLRGAVEMIRAIEHVSTSRTVRLLLIGKPEPPAVLDALRALPGFAHVEYRGWQPPESIPEWLEQANIGLLCLLPDPRYQTSLPVKMFEYMAMGIPVVASNFDTWREIIESPANGILVDPENPVEIASAINYLLENPEIAEEMGQVGRLKVLDRYNWDQERPKLLRLYEDVLA